MYCAIAYSYLLLAHSTIIDSSVSDLTIPDSQEQTILAAKITQSTQHNPQWQYSDSVFLCEVERLSAIEVSQIDRLNCQPCQKLTN